MTFSIAARCPETGMLGVAVTSSSISVGARCAAARAGIGAALSQNITDPRLGPALLDRLGQGLSPAEALADLGTKHDINPRQLAVIDRQGRIAWHSGAGVIGLNNGATGQDCVAIGNILANDRIPLAVVDAFEASSGPLPGRLIAALEGGLAAGGEAGPIRSAGLLVAWREAWPYVDLRVDWHETPLAELAALWRLYRDQADDYVTRALNPENAPAFGVPGNP
jgi:uncharacterized Ntn-hydrolase superfamily protein